MKTKNTRYQKFGWKKCFTSILVIALLVQYGFTMNVSAASISSGYTIDFDDVTMDSGWQESVGNWATKSDEFTIENTKFTYSHGTASNDDPDTGGGMIWFHNSLGDAGSRGIWFQADSGTVETVTIETVSGDEFKLTGFDLSHVEGGLASATGYKDGDSTGTQTLTVGSSGHVTLNSSFDDVDKVVLTSADGGFKDVFDNFDFQPADPSPSDDASLTSVASETDSTPGPQSGADISNSIIWEIDVDNAKATLGLTDISTAANSTVNMYSSPGFADEITGSDTVSLYEGGVTTVYIKVTAEDGTSVKYYAVTIARAAKDGPDYSINGSNHLWTDVGGFIPLTGDDTLVLYNAPNKEIKIDVSSPDDSNVTIIGNSENFEDMYVVVQNDITLNIEDLNITSPTNKPALELKKEDNATDTTMTINVSGTNNIAGNGYGSGIYSNHDQKVIIKGDGVLNATGGDSTIANGGDGIILTGYTFVPFGPGADLTIEGDVTVNATGGSSTNSSGGIGILAAWGNILVKGGNVTAKSGTSYSTNFGPGTAFLASFPSNDHSLGGNITIEGGTVTAIGADAEHSVGGGGINANNLSISGGTVQAVGGDSVDSNGGTAIYVFKKDLNITGGTVTATGGNGNTNPSLGLYNDYGDINLTGGSISATGGKGNINGSHAIFAYRGSITIDNGVDVTAIGGDGGTGVGGVGVRASGYNSGTNSLAGNTVTVSNDAGDVYVRGGQGATEQRASVMGKDVFIATGNIGSIVMEGSNPRSIKNVPGADDVYMLSVSTDPADAVEIQSNVAGTMGNYTYRAATKPDGVAHMWLPAASQTVAAADYVNKTVSVETDQPNAVTISKLTVPGAPTGVSATAGDSNAEVSFSAPADNGGSPITGYTVYVYENGIKQGALTTSGTSSPIAVAGLTNGQTYTFTVVTTNALGDSIESAPSSPVTPSPAATVPSAPTGVSATAGDRKAEVSFAAPVHNGGSPITGYTVYVYENGVKQGALTTSGTSSPIAVAGLTNGKMYTFTVVATNTLGDSIESAASSPIIPRATVPPVMVPGAPTEVKATAGDSKAVVSFAAPAHNGGSPITGYTVYVYENGVRQEALTTYGASSPITVTGLTNGTTYTFTVVATNAQGDSVESAASAPVTPGTAAATVPDAPTGVRATAGDSKAVVNFAAPTHNGGSPITGYTVYVYENSVKQGALTTSGASSPITVTGLTNGTTYTFTVVATNAVGDSVESAASGPVTPRRTSSGGGSGGSSNSGTTATNTNTNAGIIVLVNGKAESLGTATNSKRGNRTVTTITLDPVKLEQKLAAEGNRARVTIPVNSKADIIVSELNGQMVKNMENQEVVLEVQTPTFSYRLPASQINIDAISEQVGKDVALADIKVQITIENSDEAMVKVVENAATLGEFMIVAPTVEFTITCSVGSKTIEVRQFNAYVERAILIPDGVDPNKITTGIVVDEDGTTHHVPTKVAKIKGKYYAIINSLTNSAYTVVWHPVEFADVSTHWAKDAINNMAARMVIAGVGQNQFAPNRDITRAEFAAVIVKALGLAPGTGTSIFRDVESSAWYAGYIETANAYGLINGYNAMTFGPNDKITREQAMAMISEAMQITGLKPDLQDSEIGSLLAIYSDGADVLEYAKASIASCLKTGIITGTSSSTIAPKKYITRAEVAAIVQKLLEKSDLI